MNGTIYTNELKTYNTRISDGRYRVVGGYDNKIEAHYRIWVKNGQFVPASIDRAVTEVVEKWDNGYLDLVGIYKLNKDTLRLDLSF